MANCAFAWGVFGLLLTDYTDRLPESLMRKFTKAMAAAEEPPPDASEHEDDQIQADCDEFIGQFVEAFKKAGIEVPEGARLYDTGSDDDRFGQCETPADEWILGFGMLQDPWTWPAMAESFRKEARFHTWCTGG